MPKESGCEKNIKHYLQKLEILIQKNKAVKDSGVEKDM